MQIKKYEAGSLKDALDAVKRELGPDAIILQTRTNKKGFGLLSGGSVEVTAAIAEKSLEKKKNFEKRLPPESKEKIQSLPARKLNQIYEKYIDRRQKQPSKSKIPATSKVKDQVTLSGSSKSYSASQRSAYSQSDSRTLQGEDSVVLNRGSSQRHPAPPPPPFHSSAAAPGSYGVSVAEEHLTANSAAMVTEDTKLAEDQKVQKLQQELFQLKQALGQLQQREHAQVSHGQGIGAVVSDGFSYDQLNKIFELLIVSGVEKGLAYQLVKKVSFELNQSELEDAEMVNDRLAYELMESIETMDLLDGVTKNQGSVRTNVDTQVIAFIGPTGVGKTTTVAKIASDAVFNRKLKVGLINIDHYRIGAEDQLKTYAQIIGIPMKSVSTAEQLQTAVSELSRMDLILIDTTGRSQRDTEALLEQSKILESIPKVRTELVVSATTRDSELLDMGQRFSKFHPEGIIFSKLDEAVSYGSIYNLSHKLKLPLLYFAMGQRVPEDLESATQERVAALIMSL